MTAVLTGLLCSICHRRLWRFQKGEYQWWHCGRCD